MATIINRHNSNTLISGTSYADSLWTFSDNSNITIDAGAGDDTVEVGSSYVLVNAGYGDDSIEANSLSDHVTVNAGGGDDTIALFAGYRSNYNVVRYAAGDGNDLVTGFGSDDILQITEGTYTTTKSGSDVIVNVSSGKITLKGVGDTSLNISGTYGSGVSAISDNYVQYSVLRGTSAGDYIKPQGWYSTVDADDGDDTIQTYADHVSINGGAGNDSIWAYTAYSTIKPGAGNDTVSLYSGYSSTDYNVIEYASGDGNDVVYGFNDTDVLEITSGTYSTTKSGNDLVVKVGSGALTLKGAADIGAKISGTKASNSYSYSRANYFTNSNDDTVISGTASADTIYNYGSEVSIDAMGGNDYIVSFATLVADSYYGYVTINAGLGNDTVSAFGHLVYVDGGAGDDSLYTSGKNNTVFGGLGADTVINYGAYSTINAGDGNDFIDNKSIGDHSTLTGGKGDDTISLSSSSDQNIITYASGDGNDVIIGFNSDDTLYITDGTYTKANDGDDLVLTVGAGKIRFADMADQDINIVGTESNGEVSVVTVKPSETIDSSEKTGDTTIINYYVNVSDGGVFIAGDNNGTINNGTINNIQGLTINNNTITVNNDFTQNLQLNQYTQYSNVINIDGTNLTTAKLLSGNSNNNSIKAGGAGSTLYGGGEGNNTLSGGAGRDFFKFTGSGNDIAQNFTAGTNSNSDVVYFTGTSISSMRRDSNYLTINAKNGTSFQVSNSESVDEAIQYSTNGTKVSAAKIGRANQSNSFTYEDGVNYYRGGNYTDVLNVTNYQSRNVWLNRGNYSGINNIDASTSTGNNTLAGNSSSNQITAGQGNDSLWGGSGSSSDTLIGGGGKDTFFYGKNDGADVINQASSSDTVNLYNVRVSDISSARVVGNTIMANFKTGGSLQINGTSSTSSIFKLASGSQWQYNGSRWQRA